MKGHGFAVDWWTLGILIYEMVTGRPPFMHSNHHRLGVLIRQGAIIFPHPQRHGIPMSEDLKDLITKLLDKDQKTRLGSNGDADELVNHAWFKGFDWDKLMKKEIDAPFKPDMEYLKNKYKGENEKAKDDEDQNDLEDASVELPSGLVSTKVEKKSKKQIKEEEDKKKMEDMKANQTTKDGEELISLA